MIHALIVGLGNPGQEYEGTRHSVGRAVVDSLAHAEAWKRKRLLHAEINEQTLADHRVVLAKTTTYMNESGRPVSALVRNLKLEAINSQLVIVHDDLDLPVGAIRLSDSGSSGGQKGVQSIIDTLKTQNFIRVRVGIGPNTTPDGHRIPAEDFVLKRFGKDERPVIDTTITRAATVIECLVSDGIDAARATISLP
ncbi:MAG: aminoacyl-tRNA hydrolase [Candidatus Uhrbacteria bacterium]